MPTISLAHAKYEIVDYDVTNFSLFDDKLAVQITLVKFLQQKWLVIDKNRHASLSLPNDNVYIRK